MSEFIEHRFSKAIRELFLYCPKEYASGVWDDNRAGFLAWKERDLLHRCYTERGFIQKIERLVEEWKSQRSKPHINQAEMKDAAWHKKGRPAGPVLNRKEPTIPDTDIPLFRESGS